VNSANVQLISLILAAGAALLNIILIPLVKSASRGAVVELVAEHNEDVNAHPARTLAAREEVSRVATNAQDAVSRVATIAQDAAAKVAISAQDAAARVAANAQDAVAKVHDGIEAQFEKVHREIHELRSEVSDVRVALAAAMATPTGRAAFRKVK
jgi:cell division septum initiation protein DivIVA